ETEFKQDIDFRDGGNTIYYRNNKTWSIMYMQQQQKFPKLVSKIMDLLLLLLGESPLRAVTQGGVSFESYPDPLITLLNSNLTKVLLSILGNPVALPNIPAMGYFPLYNHTCDEDYVIKTGKDNTD
ncbi:hypothetical protein TELCIR_16885, partial [Teladorsagia circumcincta]